MLSLSPEYKWNGTDWIWSYPVYGWMTSMDDGGSVQGSGGGGRSGQSLHLQFNNIEGSGDMDDYMYSDEEDAGSGTYVSGSGGGGGGAGTKPGPR